MTTLNQKLANQNNAKRSSGPKTDEGRRRSAVNATSHGLNIAIENSRWGHLLHKIESLLVKDGYDQGCAKNLALCILDFERNIFHIKEIFQKLDVVRDIKNTNFDMKSLNVFGEKGMSKRQLYELECEPYKKLKAADRYFRRSANQLIKKCKTI